MTFEINYDERAKKMYLSECGGTPCEYDVSNVDECVEIIRDYMQNSVNDIDNIPEEFLNPKKDQFCYLIGDATKPVCTYGDDNQIIAHICNNKGGWGAGFVLALSKLSKLPENAYRNAFKNNKDFGLGFVDFVTVKEHNNMEKGLIVANMVAQNGYKSEKNPIPLSYKYLEECLDKLGEYASKVNATIHMPKIGTGLAGGDWEIISQLINNKLCSRGLRVYVYKMEE